jgi:hypothetical protein
MVDLAWAALLAPERDALLVLRPRLVDLDELLVDLDEFVLRLFVRLEALGELRVVRWLVDPFFDPFLLRVELPDELELRDLVWAICKASLRGRCPNVLGDLRIDLPPAAPLRLPPGNFIRWKDTRRYGRSGSAASIA